MRDLRKLLLLIGYVLNSLCPLAGQNAANPFELIPRLDQPLRSTNSVSVLTEQQDSSHNPFDLILDQPRPTDFTTYEVDPRVSPIINSDKERFLFFSIGIMVILFTIAISLVGTYLNKAIQAFLNDNAFNQYFREQSGRGAAPYFVLYTLFFVYIGFFTLLLLNDYQVHLPGNGYYLQWALLSTVIALLFLGKQLLLMLVRLIFPVASEIRQYTFLIITSAIVTATVLLPANLLLAYGPEGSGTWVRWATISVLLLIYLLHLVRSLFIANKPLLLHTFHFLLYICTVEIAPVVIILRLILDKL